MNQPRNAELVDILVGLRAEQQQQSKTLEQQNNVLSKQDLTLEKQNLLLATLQTKLALAEQSAMAMSEAIDKLSKSVIDTQLKLCEIVSILEHPPTEENTNVTHPATRRSRRKNPGIR